MTLELTVICAPPEPASPDDAGTFESARSFNAVDEFAAALGAAAGSTVRVIEGTLADAPATGYVLAFAPMTLDGIARIGPRVVLVKADGATVRDDLEEHRLAAAIVRARYFDWQQARDREVGRGVIGRKDLAAAIHATSTTVYSTEHYATLESAHYANLPSLLVAYLAAHADAAAEASS
jgi:hypothetical protein